jgi:prevent-host-death family protein
MQIVGIRELKSRLSEYLRAVRTGEEVLVTDRGRVIARLGPPSTSTLAELPHSVAELARQGLLRPGTGNRPELYPRSKHRLPRGTSLDLLSDERGHR